jgi:O-methyltransferase domain
MYLLARVLHDWDDDAATQILGALDQGATQGTRLRMFETLLPDDHTPHRAKTSDVSMMLLFGGGRERSADEFVALLEGTGWRFERVVASPGPMSVIEASRQPPG